MWRRTRTQADSPRTDSPHSIFNSQVLHHRGQIPKIQRQQEAQQKMAGGSRLHPSLDPAGLFNGKRSRPHLSPGNKRLQRARNTAAWDSPNLCPGEFAGAGMQASLDAWSFLQVSPPLGFLPSLLPRSRAIIPGGLALNPSLHVTFSTVSRCLCVYGDDVIESASILGPQDVGCGYCLHH